MRATLNRRGGNRDSGAGREDPTGQRLCRGSAQTASSTFGCGSIDVYIEFVCSNDVHGIESPMPIRTVLPESPKVFANSDAAHLGMFGQECQRNSVNDAVPHNQLCLWADRDHGSLSLCEETISSLYVYGCKLYT